MNNASIFKDHGYIYSHAQSEALYLELLQQNIPVIGFDNRIKKDDEIIEDILSLVKDKTKKIELSFTRHTDRFFSVESEILKTHVGNLNAIIPK